MLRKSLLILIFGIVITESAALAQPFGGPPLPRPGLGGLPHPVLGGPSRFAGPGPRARLAGPMRSQGGDRGFAAHSYGQAARYGYARRGWRRHYGVYAYGSGSYSSSGCYYTSKYSSRQKSYRRVLVCSGSEDGRG